MGPSLARRIERALSHLERGSTLTEAMWAGLSRGNSTHRSSDVPQPVDWKARAELESALLAVQRLRAGPHPRPRPEFRAAAHERIVAAARASGCPAGVKPDRRRSLIRRFLPFAAALGLVASGAIVSFVANPAGTAFADALAPAVYAVEQIQLAAVADDDARARLSLLIAERRRAELESAATAGQFDRAANIAARYSTSLAIASQAGTIGNPDAALASRVADESELGAAAIARVAESAPSPIANQLRSLTVASPTPTATAPILASTTVDSARTDDKTETVDTTETDDTTETVVATATPAASATSRVAASPTAEPTKRSTPVDSRPEDPRFEIASRAAELATLALSEVGKPPATATLPAPRATIELASRSQSSSHSGTRTQTQAQTQTQTERPDSSVAKVPKAVVPTVSVPKVTVVVPTIAVSTPRVVRPAATPTPRAQPTATATATASKSATTRNGAWWSLFGD